MKFAPLLLIFLLAVVGCETSTTLDPVHGNDETLPSNPSLAPPVVLTNPLDIYGLQAEVDRLKLELAEARRNLAMATIDIVYINEATVEELCTLPGIGVKTADRIIAYRIKIEGYTGISDLLNVERFGPAKLEKLRPFLALGEWNGN